MRRVKATVAAACAVLLIGAGAIVAFADSDSDASHGSRAGAPGARAAAATPSSLPAPPATGACGAATPEVVANVDGKVAERVYAEELHGTETFADRQQVASYAPLLSALRSGSDAAVRAAVEALVYSHTHIVRLRVSEGSRLLADVGGPYIIAPVTGTLREHGRTVARFSFSVQDDLGFVKLVTRFAGVPLVLRSPSGQIPVEGQAASAPSRIPVRGPVSYEGATFEAYSFSAAAYPQGTLRVSLLSPPRVGLSGQRCAQVAADETARVAARIAKRFPDLGPGDLQTYTSLVPTITGAKAIVEAAGRTYLAGGAMPRRVPSSGAVEIGRRRWYVATTTVTTTLGDARVSVLLAA